MSDEVQRHKSILIVSFTFLDRDPRIRRQVAFVKDDYHIVTLARGALDDTDVEHVSVEPWLERNRSVLRRSARLIGRLTGEFNLTYGRDRLLTPELLRLANRPLGLIIANDIETLQLAVELASYSGAPILLDAHEMELWHRSEISPRRCGPLRSSQWFCATFVPQAQRILTVSESIAEHFRCSYGLPCDVVTNAPFFVNQAPQPTRSDAIRLVYHGGTNASRGLQNMIELIDRLDNRFSLDLLLMPNDRAVYRDLAERAATHPRVRLQPPVPVEQIATRLNAYDLGVYMLIPNVLNQKLALPNKLFEFVQARLGVAVWPSPEMARLVTEHGLGVVSEDYSVGAMARALNSLQAEDIQRFKDASHAVAPYLCAESNRTVVQQVVQGLLGAGRVDGREARCAPKGPYHSMHTR